MLQPIRNRNTPERVIELFCHFLAAGQETPVEREPPTPPKAEPPPIDIVYLGSFGKPGRRIAVFSDDESVYNALVGDVIKEKFVLVAIGYESADLKFVGFPEVGPSRLAAGGMR